MFELRKTASTFIIVLSIWLGASAVFWTHSSAQIVNALLTGGLMGTCAILGGAAIRVGFAGCAALAVWLFTSVWVLSGATPGLVMHHMLVSVLAFGFACGPLAEPGRLSAET